MKRKMQMLLRRMNSKAMDDVPHIRSHNTYSPERNFTLKYINIGKSSSFWGIRELDSWKYLLLCLKYYWWSSCPWGLTQVVKGWDVVLGGSSLEVQLPYGNEKRKRKKKRKKIFTYMVQHKLLLGPRWEGIYKVINPSYYKRDLRNGCSELK